MHLRCEEVASLLESWNGLSDNRIGAAETVTRGRRANYSGMLYDVEAAFRSSSPVCCRLHPGLLTRAMLPPLSKANKRLPPTAKLHNL